MSTWFRGSGGDLPPWMKLANQLCLSQAHVSRTAMHTSLRVNPCLKGIGLLLPSPRQDAKPWATHHKSCQCQQNIQCCGSTPIGLGSELDTHGRNSQDKGKSQHRRHSKTNRDSNSPWANADANQQSKSPLHAVKGQADVPSSETAQTMGRARTASLQILDAYTTILMPPALLSSTSASHGTGLQWTNDDRLEAADRAAIRKAEATRMASHAAAQSELPPPPTVITRLPTHITTEVLDNAMVLVDKPLMWEDEEVARSLRWALPVDRLGYVEALEAGATGLMLLLIGKATALTSIMSGLGSRYTATVRLGISTDTHDASGQPTDSGPWQHVTDDVIQQVAVQLTGRHVQVPPALSAVHVKGKPVYELAKRRHMQDMVPRPVTITQLSLERVEPGSRDLHLDVTFARYGYVRSLAHEIGQRLGCGAHVTQIRRVAAGGFSVDNAWTLDVLLPVARKFGKELKKRNGN